MTLDKKEYLRQYYIANREKLLSKNKERYDTKKGIYNLNRRIKREQDSEFREKDNETSRKWRQDNREYYLSKLKEWRQDNKDIVNFHGSVKRARKKNAIPNWLSEDDKWIIKEIYKLARERTKLTGIDWHVDHIVPLKGQVVCGLHVPWNLRVILGIENLKKNNKLEQDIV